MYIWLLKAVGELLFQTICIEADIPVDGTSENAQARRSRERILVQVNFKRGLEHIHMSIL